ncbi:hypothetical protein OAT72_03295 [Alphaproteobacteria bacterium]|nr:hypothetical protein [Alphaproteobacteria bacterium]
MAESKKPSDKTKNTRGKSASNDPKHTVIDGVAVDKSSAADTRENTRADTRADMSADKTKAADSDRPGQTVTLWAQSATMVVAGIAAMLALLSLAVSVVAYRQTADLADAGPVQPTTGGGITAPVQADLDAINERLDRLAALVSTNAVQYASLQQDSAAAPMPDTPDTPDNNMAPPAGGLDTAMLDDVISRLSALEAARSSQDMTTSRAGQTPPGDAANTAGASNKAQTGLLAAAGLLAENLAGRQLGVWVSVLENMQWPGVAADHRDIIRAAADVPVESRVDLLSLGRLQLGPMVQGLNSVEDNSGLLDQARARLADLVKLRRVGGGADQPAKLLAAFEAALDHADFEAAFAAATIWSSAGLDGLDSWLAAAQRRRDLDQAVNQLVAVFVRQAAGKS